MSCRGAQAVRSAILSSSSPAQVCQTKVATMGEVAGLANTHLVHSDRRSNSGHLSVRALHQPTILPSQAGATVKNGHPTVLVQNLVDRKIVS